MDGGGLGQKNLGDELLLVAFRELLTPCNLYVVRGERYERAFAQFVNVFQAGVLAGGTVIDRHPNALRVVQRWLPYLERSFVFGSGVADPSFWTGRKEGRRVRASSLAAWVPLLSQCCYVGVRGPRSASLLRDAGLERVEVIGDPVLMLARDHSVEITPRTIGLNIGLSRGHIWGSEERLVSEFVALATEARRAGWRVKWFVVWPDDFESTKYVAKESGTDQDIYELYSDHQSFFELVRPLTVFVGVKLHAVALATCAFVPSIMLEYRPKCRDYMQSIGHEQFTIRTDAFHGRQVWQIIAEMGCRRSELAARLRCTILDLRDRQIQRAREIVNSLRGYRAK